MIPQETIDQIREQSDIVQIINEFLRLKKRGRNFLALCPFHTEKTPSFNVNPDRQIYHCFGCGKGGNVITFLMEHEKMSFVEAIRYLARKANIHIREEKQSDYKKDLIDKVSFANRTALEYFGKVLKSSRYKHILDTYLKKNRQITDEAINYFQLGLAGEEWEGLLDYAHSKDLSSEDLDTAGLALYSDKTKKHFDRFRQRLMIPIFNLSGKPIAFGGRTLKKGEPAKYINSPETVLYNKSNVLYGLNFAKDSIRDLNEVYIVEGYFDVISLWQIGIKNVVASSGTAFTQQQARFLARFAETAYLFFDSDSAGRNAALKSVDVLYDAGMEVKIIQPIEGEDPDSIAKKFGIDKIEELRHDAIGFIPFRIQDVKQSETGIIAKEKLIKELSAIGSKIQDPTRRSLFFSEAAEKIGVDSQIFQKSLPKKTAEPEQVYSALKKMSKVEYNFISLLFQHPGSIDSIFENISADDIDSKQLSRLYSAIIQQYKTTGVVDARGLIDIINDPEYGSLITEVASIEWEPRLVDSEVNNYIKLIFEEKRKKQRLKLQQQLAEAEANGDSKKADLLLEEIKSLSKNVKKH